MIEIDQNGKKDFSSIQEALDCLAKTPDSGKGETLFLHSGIYREQITVRIPHLTFLGEEDGSTVITGCLSARMEAPEGGPLRTFRTFTCFIDTHDFTAYMTGAPIFQTVFPPSPRSIIRSRSRFISSYFRS